MCFANIALFSFLLNVQKILLKRFYYVNSSFCKSIISLFFCYIFGNSGNISNFMKIKSIQSPVKWSLDVQLKETVVRVWLWIKNKKWLRIVRMACSMLQLVKSWGFCIKQVNCEITGKILVRNSKYNFTDYPNDKKAKQSIVLMWRGY